MICSDHSWVQTLHFNNWLMVWLQLTIYAHYTLHHFLIEIFHQSILKTWTSRLDHAIVNMRQNQKWKKLQHAITKLYSSKLLEVNFFFKPLHILKLPFWFSNFAIKFAMEWEFGSWDWPNLSFYSWEFLDNT